MARVTPGEGGKGKAARTARGSVLIADDCLAERKSLGMALDRAGYEVLEAEDGLAALDLVRRHRPELLVTDLLMPGLDGYELVRRIRSLPDVADTRVIFWSATFLDEEARILAMALGASRFFGKPVVLGEFLETVAAVLEEPRPAVVSGPVLAALEEAHRRLMGDKLLERTIQLERELAERRQLEGLARQSEQRFAGLVESAMDAIISIDGDQRIVLFNAAAEAMFGCPAAEALGSSLERFIPPRFREGHADHIRQFGATGITSRAMGRLGTLSGVRSDGLEFPIEASISQVEVGGKRFFTVILRDISERKRLEEALQRMNEELEARVAQRTAELMEANEALLKSNLELQRFAYVAAHDLQTPLRSISGFAQLLQKDYQGRLDHQADELIRRVVDNAQRIHVLIHELLVYSRIESRGHPFRPTAFNQLFDEVKASLEGPIRDSGAQVRREELPVIVGDRSQLAQLLENLIDNGIKYRGSEPPRILVTAEPAGKEWLFSVRDNGIGIAPRHHQRIFEIFRRLHTQQTYPGTGIGLALCRRVVERHGGRIWIDSEPGKGTTFHFTLPRKPLETNR